MAPPTLESIQAKFLHAALNNTGLTYSAQEVAILATLEFDPQPEPEPLPPAIVREALPELPLDITQTAHTYLLTIAKDNDRGIVYPTINGEIKPLEWSKLVTRSKEWCKDGKLTYVTGQRYAVIENTKEGKILVPVKKELYE
jgi:hypothetical protein